MARQVKKVIDQPVRPAGGQIKPLIVPVCQAKYRHARSLTCKDIIHGITDHYAIPGSLSELGRGMQERTRIGFTHLERITADPDGEVPRQATGLEQQRRMPLRFVGDTGHSKA